MICSSNRYHGRQGKDDAGGTEAEADRADAPVLQYGGRVREDGGILCRKEQTGWDLQEIVEAYEAVDDFIDRYAPLLRNEKVLSQTVDIFYGSGGVPEDLAFVKKQLDEKHIPILFLMLTGGLPRLSAKNGDVQNIQEAPLTLPVCLLRPLIQFARCELAVCSGRTVSSLRANW